MESVNSHLVGPKGAPITTQRVNIDLARKMLALHEVDDAGKPVLAAPIVPRAKLLDRVTALPSMEACPGEHRWVCLLLLQGHTAWPMAPAPA